MNRNDAELRETLSNSLVDFAVMLKNTLEAAEKHPEMNAGIAEVFGAFDEGLQKLVNENGFEGSIHEGIPNFDRLDCKFYTDKIAKILFKPE